MSSALEIIVPHVPNAAPVTQVRSTLLQSSLTSLRERGHFEAWSSVVDPAYRNTILEAVGPTWLPIQVAAAHYQACDELKLPQRELVAIGESVGVRVQNTFLGSIRKAAGISPWLAVPHFGRVWARLMTGGSAQISKTGPKDLHIELKGLSLTRFAYFRHAYSGLVRGGMMATGARIAYVNIVRFQATTYELVLSGAWA